MVFVLLLLLLQLLRGDEGKDIIPLYFNVLFILLNSYYSLLLFIYPSLDYLELLLGLELLL